MVACLVLLVASSGVAEEPPSSVTGQPPSSVTARAADGRLWLRAERAPLDAVLAAIGKATGLSVHLDPSVAPHAAQHRVDLVLDDVALDQALSRVLAPTHYVLLYTRAGPAEARVYAWATPGTGPPPSPKLAAARPRAAQTSEPDADEAAARREAARLSRAGLADPNPERRAAALEELSGFGDPALVTRTAFDVLAQEREHQVLDTALDLLSGLETFPLEPLLQFAGVTADRGLRIRALELLAEHGRGDPRVSGLVRTLARQDRDPDFRETAADLLRSLAAE